MKLLCTLINIYLQKLWDFIGYFWEKPQFKASNRMIRSDAGVYSTVHENVDNNIIFQDQKQIDALHISDLNYMEKDLDFYEKVNKRKHNRLYNNNFIQGFIIISCLWWHKNQCSLCSAKIANWCTQ